MLQKMNHLQSWKWTQSEDDDTINHHVDQEPQQERQERFPPDRYGEWVYIAQEEDPVT